MAAPEMRTPAGGPASAEETKDLAIVHEADAYRAAVAARDKVFQTLRARFALAGWALYITAIDGRASFAVSKWGRVREFGSLAELERFASIVGVDA
jgi:hypothetical protein